MSSKQDPAGIGIHDDDATIAAALAEASIPCLIMSMIHMSGDATILDGDIKPLGVYINEFQGYMDEDSKEEIRRRALDIIREFRDGGCKLPPLARLSNLFISVILRALL